MSRTQAIVVALVAIVAAAAGMLLARVVVQKPSLSQSAMVVGTLLQPPRALPELALIDHAGHPFDLARLQNRWSLLFFGFTNCPDLCPMTLGVLKQVEKKLTDLPSAQQPQVVLISVDPERDTPAQLASYVKFFSPSFVGVTGSQSAIEHLTSAMSVPVAIRRNADGSYSVDHSGSVFLVDPQGRLHALFSPPHDPAKIAADYRRIVSG